MRSALRHYIGPCELISSSLPTLLSYVPSLHGHYPFLRYYGRSDPDRPFYSHRPWFPDSRQSDFRPFCLQPSTVLHQPRPLPLRWQLYFVRASSLRSQTRQNRRPNRVHFDPLSRICVTDWSFTSSCSPPGVIAPMQLLSVSGSSVSARSGTFTLLSNCALRRTAQPRCG